MAVVLHIFILIFCKKIQAQNCILLQFFFIASLPVCQTHKCTFRLDPWAYSCTVSRADLVFWPISTFLELSVAFFLQAWHFWSINFLNKIVISSFWSHAHYFYLMNKVNRNIEIFQKTRSNKNSELKKIISRFF